MKLSASRQSPEDKINLLEEVIDSLIFSNIQKFDDSWDLTLNYGPWQLRFKANPENSLRDALNFFKCEIALIKSGVKREHNRNNKFT